MTAIQASVAAIQDADTHVAKDVRSGLLRNIAAESRRLEHFIVDPLALSRLESGIRPNLTLNAPGEVVSAILDRHMPLLVGREIQFDVPDTLPLFHLDASLLEQSLGNLLDNVAVHTPADAHVWITGRIDKDGELRLEVADSGPGIPAEARERIFGKFERLENRGPGAGLGLALACATPEARGGELRVEPSATGGAALCCVCQGLATGRSHRQQQLVRWASSRSTVFRAEAGMAHSMWNRLFSRRELLRSAALVGTTAVAVSAVAACGTVPLVSGGKTKLTVWADATFAPNSDDFQTKTIEDWGASKGIDVEVVRDTGGNIQTKLQAAIESKQFPDISQVDVGRFTQFYPSKVFVDVSDLYEDFAKSWGGFYSVAEKTVTQDGKQWMLPYSIDTSLCLHWKDMLEGVGVKSPEGLATWDQFFAGCKKASNPPEVYPVGYQLSKCSDAEGTYSLMMYSFGASLVKEDSKTINIKTPQMKQFLEYFKKQYEDGMFPPGATGWDNASDNTALQGRQIVADEDPASVLVWLRDNRPEDLPKLGVASTPGGPAGQFNSAYVRDGFAVMATGDEKRIGLGKDLMRQLYSKEVYRQWIGLAFPAPAVKGMEDHEVWKNPQRKGFLDAAKSGVLGGYPGTPTTAWAELNTRMPVATMIVRIAVDKWTPEQAMDEADQVARDVYGKYYKP